MEEQSPNWTKEELKTYILIYCANADFSESKLEVDYIKSKVKTEDFDNMHTAFEKDNDFASIQKIQASVEQHGYNSDEKLNLFDEIKELFLSDKEYDVLEQNLFRGLRNILKK